MTNCRLKKIETFSKNWVNTLNSLKIQQKNCFSPQNGNLYAYAANNPVKYTDPDGNSTEVTLDDDGNYVVCGGCADDDVNIYIIQNGERNGEILGKSLTPFSFLDNINNPVIIPNFLI